MHTFEWDNQFDTGFEQIDAEHKKIFQRVAACFELARSGAAKDELIVLLNAIYAKLADHFADEESLTGLADKQYIETHKDIHDTLLRDLKIKITDFTDGNGSKISAQDIIAFVFDWYVTHIKNEDLKLVNQTKTAIVKKISENRNCESGVNCHKAS